MTFRPPGATPISIVDPGSEEPAEQEQPKPKSLVAPRVKSGGSKVALIVAGVVALAALGVALGWFLTS
jgi:flagellar basal body-associated protein FliL